MPTVTDFPPPNRSRRTIFMDAVMNGVVPDDAIDPTADYVPNPE
uniref:Uncharacterized protein n=1 Tax=Panagrolaimus sp. JU765 TaxID=591449 RepID=A0AC34RQM1_9BILA